LCVIELAVLHFLEHFLLIAVTEFLFEEEFSMVKQGVLNVRIAGVAPVREVCERKRDWMSVVWVFILVVKHVTFNISAALYSSATWFEAHPILADISTVWTSIIHSNPFKAFFRQNVFRRAVRAIFLWSYCEKARWDA